MLTCVAPVAMELAMASYPADIANPSVIERDMAVMQRGQTILFIIHNGNLVIVLRLFGKPQELLMVQ